MFVLLLPAGIVLAGTGMWMFVMGREEMQPIAFLIGLAGVISFAMFLGGMMNSIGEYDRAFEKACVEIGGTTFEGEWNAATKVAPTECVRFVDGQPVNISDDARESMNP